MFILNELKDQYLISFGYLVLFIALHNKCKTEITQAYQNILHYDIHLLDMYLEWFVFL